MAKQVLTEQEKIEKLRKKEVKHQTNEKIFDILFVEDELSWQNVIYALVDEEHMDPWDIDVAVLSKKFLEMLAKLKELDFRISGKMVLASAILLKMKSDVLMDEDLTRFDNMMNATEENLPLDVEGKPVYDMSGKPQIFPRTPQPRKRKVSVFDLVKALEKALQVESKRFKYTQHKKIEIPVMKNEFDLTKSMFKIYDYVKQHYDSKKTKDKILTFDELIPSNSKKDKVLTFIPLLHLDTQRKVDMDQQTHFETIAIKLAEKIDVAKLEAELLKMNEEEAKLAKIHNVENGEPVEKIKVKVEQETKTETAIIPALSEAKETIDKKSKSSTKNKVKKEHK